MNLFTGKVTAVVSTTVYDSVATSAVAPAAGLTLVQYINLSKTTGKQKPSIKPAQLHTRAVTPCNAIL